jgi:hypothetical protein
MFMSSARGRGDAHADKKLRASHLHRLSDYVWGHILSYNMVSLKNFDVVDDLENCNLLRNLTLVNSNWNVDLNTDVLWKSVWLQWKKSRNACWGLKKHWSLKVLDTQLQGCQEKVDPVLLLKINTERSSKMDGNLWQHKRSTLYFDMDLAPPTLRSSIALQNQNGIVLDDKHKIKSGYARAFKFSLSTCCVNCRIAPLKFVSVLSKLQGDKMETNEFEYNIFSRESKNHESVTDFDAKTGSSIAATHIQRTRPGFLRPRTPIDYTETTTAEDQEEFDSRTASSSSSSSSSVGSFEHLLCDYCRYLGKQREVVEGFTHGSLLVESRAIFEYASTKGQLAKLQHVKKSWFGKESRIYLRRHVIASSRKRFPSFHLLVARKKSLKRSAPQRMEWSTIQKLMGYEGHVFCEECGCYHSDIADY